MFKIRTTTNYFVENFPWESKAQEESFLSFLQWLRKIPAALVGHPVFLLCAFFAQKDHESNEWIVEVIGDRVRRLEDEIQLLRGELQTMRDRLQ